MLDFSHAVKVLCQGNSDVQQIARTSSAGWSSGTFTPRKSRRSSAKFMVLGVCGQQQQHEFALDEHRQLRLTEKTPPIPLSKELVAKLQLDKSMHWSLELGKAVAQAALLDNRAQIFGCAPKLFQLCSTLFLLSIEQSEHAANWYYCHAGISDMLMILVIHVVRAKNHNTLKNSCWTTKEQCHPAGILGAHQQPQDLCWCRSQEEQLEVFLSGAVQLVKPGGDQAGVHKKQELKQLLEANNVFESLTAKVRAAEGLA